MTINIQLKSMRFNLRLVTLFMGIAACLISIQPASAQEFPNQKISNAMDPQLNASEVLYLDKNVGLTMHNPVKNQNSVVEAIASLPASGYKHTFNDNAVFYLSQDKRYIMKYDRVTMTKNPIVNVGFFDLGALLTLKVKNNHLMVVFERLSFVINLNSKKFFFPRSAGSIDIVDDKVISSHQDYFNGRWVISELDMNTSIRKEIYRSSNINQVIRELVVLRDKSLAFLLDQSGADNVTQIVLFNKERNQEARFPSVNKMLVRLLATGNSLIWHESDNGVYTADVVNQGTFKLNNVRHIAPPQALAIRSLSASDSAVAISFSNSIPGISGYAPYATLYHTLPAQYNLTRGDVSNHNPIVEGSNIIFNRIINGASSLFLYKSFYDYETRLTFNVHSPIGIHGISKNEVAWVNQSSSTVMMRNINSINSLRSFPYSSVSKLRISDNYLIYSDQGKLTQIDIRSNYRKLIGMSNDFDHKDKSIVFVSSTLGKNRINYYQQGNVQELYTSSASITNPVIVNDNLVAWIEDMGMGNKEIIIWDISAKTKQVLTNSKGNKRRLVSHSNRLFWMVTDASQAVIIKAWDLGYSGERIIARDVVESGGISASGSRVVFNVLDQSQKAQVRIAAIYDPSLIIIDNFLQMYVHIAENHSVNTVFMRNFLVYVLNLVDRLPENSKPSAIEIKDSALLKVINMRLGSFTFWESKYSVTNVNVTNLIEELNGLISGLSSNKQEGERVKFVNAINSALDRRLGVFIAKASSLPIMDHQVAAALNEARSAVNLLPVNKRTTATKLVEVKIAAAISDRLDTYKDLTESNSVTSPNVVNALREANLAVALLIDRPVGQLMVDEAIEEVIDDRILAYEEEAIEKKSDTDSNVVGAKNEAYASINQLTNVTLKQEKTVEMNNLVSGIKVDINIALYSLSALGDSESEILPLSVTHATVKNYLKKAWEAQTALPQDLQSEYYEEIVDAIQGVVEDRISAYSELVDENGKTHNKTKKAKAEAIAAIATLPALPKELRTERTAELNAI